MSIVVQLYQKLLLTDHVQCLWRITESQNSRGWKGPLWVI